MPERSPLLGMLVPYPLFQPPLRRCDADLQARQASVPSPVLDPVSPAADLGAKGDGMIQKRIVSDYDIFDRPLARYEGKVLVEIDGKQIDLNELVSPFEREKEAE